MKTISEGEKKQPPKLRAGGEAVTKVPRKPG